MADLDVRAGAPASARSRERFALGMRAAARPTGLVLGTVVAVLLYVSLQATGILLWFVVPDLMWEGGLVTGSLAFLSIWLLTWVWLRAKERRPFATIGFLEHRRAPWQIARGAGVALLAMSVIVALGVATGQLTFLELIGGGYPDWSATGWVLVALVAFAVQGGAEELMTRGYLMQVWFRRTGLVGAVIATTVFFTAAHGFNAGFSVVPALTLVAVSILLVFWSLAEGGLWGVIAFHAIWNWSQGSLYGISVSGNPSPNALFAVSETPDADPLLSGGQFGIEGSIITVAVLAALCAGAVTAYVRGRRR